MTLLDFFTEHTYRMVFFGTVIIGGVAGALGTFAYLRKQSLISDVISHSALPGVLAAFLLAVGLGLDGRNMVALIIGASITGIASVVLANAIHAHSRIKIDTAMAISLSMFFGAGILLMRVITNAALPGKGGIQDYLFGNASVITKADLLTSLVVGAGALGVMALAWKEFQLRTFDGQMSGLMGFNGRKVDALMFISIVLGTIIGVKAVGLVLMVAFVVTPPAIARQWVNSLWACVLLSGVIGALSSALGAYLSIALGGIPTGPLIVLVLTAIFVFTWLFAPRRSILARAWSRRRHRLAFIAEVSGGTSEIKFTQLRDGKKAGMK